MSVPSESDFKLLLIPLLPELESTLSSLYCEFGMEGLHRAITTLSDDSGEGLDVLQDMDVRYDTDCLQPLTDAHEICKLGYHFISDPIVLNDRNLSVDDGFHDSEATLYELKSVDASGRENASPNSASGDSTFDYGSDGTCSDSGMGSPEVQWEIVAEGPLPPVSDILPPHKDHDFTSLPMLIKPEPLSDSDQGSSDSMDCGSYPHYTNFFTLPHGNHQHHLPHQPFYTNHDYTITPPMVDGNNNEMLRSSQGMRGGASLRKPSACGKELVGEGEKGMRKKPGRKKGQVSKVLHLWEFIRDLLNDPKYCPRIIHWENEAEGVFRVLQSSEVARLWGDKKKNKKTMTYEKLSRSLRYSRKEGYFDSLPKNQGYPKKLCFKFGPKSHGWREYGCH